MTEQSGQEGAFCTDAPAAEAKHGELDASAGEALEWALAALRNSGVDMDAGQVMSAAIRLYASALAGRVEVRETEALEQEPEILLH